MEFFRQEIEKNLNYKSIKGYQKRICNPAEEI